MSVNFTPKKTKRQEQKTATRQKLKAAAMQCFKEKGFGETQISDITQLAGVAQGTFYVHFSDKEVLLAELLHEFNEALVEQFQRIPWLLLPSFQAGIEQMVDLFLTTWDTHQHFISVYTQRLVHGSTSLEVLRDGLNPETHEWLTSLLERMVVFPHKEKLHLMVHALLAMWMRIGMQYLFYKLDRQMTKETLVSLTMGVLSTCLPLTKS